MKSNTSQISSALYFCAAVLCLVPWAFYQHQVSISGDSSFLMFSAEKLLAGLKMSEHYYDNNPPLSFLIYIPAVLIKNAEISAHNAIQFYAGITAILSAVTSFLIIRNVENLSPALKTIAPTCVLYIGTILFLTEFSLKDHFITLALFPFVCAQYLIAQNQHKKPQLLLALTFIVFGIFLFVKPHYGIIPIYMILHRAIKNRSAKAAFKSDFWILSLLAISYAAYIAIASPDFISEVFATSMDLYAFSTTTRSLLPQTIGFATITTLCLMLTGSNTMNNGATKDSVHDLKFIQQFAIVALLSIIPFYIQNKGFYGHFLPSLSLLVFCVLLLTTHYVRSIFKQNYHILIMAVAVTLTFNLVLILPNSTSKKESFKKPESAFINAVEKHAQNKTIFIEAYSTHLFWKHKIYNDIEISSRFPSLWFLSDFALFDKKKQYDIWLKFGNMMAEDIERNKPDILLLLEPKQENGGFYNVFKKHSQLGILLSNYESTEEILPINKDRFGILRKADEPQNQNYIIYKRVR